MYKYVFAVIVAITFTLGIATAIWAYSECRNMGGSSLYCLYQASK